MAKFVAPLLITASLFTCSVSADSSAEFEASRAAMLAEFSESRKAVLDEFEESKAAYLASFEAYKKELSSVWDNPELTNKSTWVQYSKDNKVKRAVNFETGEVVVEVAGKDLTPKQVQQAVQGQLEELKTETTATAFKKDRVINSKVPNKLVAEQKMLPDVDVKALNKTATSSQKVQQNGLTITRVAMKVPPKSIAKKAMIYLPDVREKSTKWSIDADLILAIMHTESHFNPMAQSAIPAYGLMQVVPTSAGKDVTKRYQGEAKLLAPEVLFKPTYNIEIGTSYLNILMSHYLNKVENIESRTYLAIASYNGGVGAVARHFTGKKSLSGLAKKANTLTPEFIYDSLVNDFPYEETRNYLKKVNAKKLFYKNMLSVQSI